MRRRSWFILFLMPRKRSLIFLLALLLDASSELRAQTLELPAVGVWNGFNGHLNVLECANASDVSYDFVVRVRSSAGAILGQQTINLLPNAGAHLVLNGFGLENSYGTYSIEHVSGAAQEDSPLNCSTVVYRFPAGIATKAVEYAFALPVRSPLRGRTAGIFNSMNPSGLIPVENWLTIYNPGSDTFSASIELFDRDGNASGGFFVDSLAAGGRRDFALGHTSGQQIGLYRIVPATANAPYGAFVTRYSALGDGRFSFAFPTQAQSGECDPGAVPASTMDPAINWGEIANSSDAPVQTDVEIRDGFGAVKLSERVTIPPRAQYHVSVNRAIGERQVGALRARCVGGGELLVQSAYYGYRDSIRPVIEWAYVSQAVPTRAFEGDRASFLVNTFFQAANWAKLIDYSHAPTPVDIAVLDGAGSSVSRAARPLFADGSVDIGLHEQITGGFTGQALAYSNTSSAQMSADLLRVFPDSRGGIGTVLRVPPRVFAATEKQRGAVKVASEGHYFEFRGDKLHVVGDSVTQAWMELGPHFNTAAYLDNLAAKKVNAFMIWSYIGIVDQSQDDRIGYHAPRRWPWEELSGNLRPPYWFNFVAPNFQAKFNEEYFRALNELVRLANERNILVIITVHDGWTKDRFSGHPLNAANGGTLTSREQYVNLASYTREMPSTFQLSWNGVERHQFFLERFSDRLIRATADYPNVMYEMFNEGEWYDQAKLRAFQQHFLDYFKARTNLPLIINDDHVGGSSFRENAQTDVISLHQPNWNGSTHSDDPFDHYASRFFGSNPFSKPLLFDEPVPEYHGAAAITNPLMRLMWGTLLGGAGFFVPNDSSWIFNPNDIDPVFLLESYASRFFHESGVRFWEMAPNGSLSSSGVCLAKVGSEYLTYVEGPVPFTVNLANAPGTYQVRFFSPRAGIYDTTVLTISGGNAATAINKPSIDDWVVWIRRVS